MYSSFRPRRRTSPDRKAKILRRHPAGDVPGSRTHVPAEAASASQGRSTAALPDEEFVKQIVHLDAGSVFTQLSAITSLAQSGPRRGFLSSILPVSEGVIRVFREWLAEQNSTSEQRKNKERESVETACDRLDAQLGKTSKANYAPSAPDPFDGVLWVNDGQNVGDEEIPVSYELQFEEVLVRTRHLLLATELSPHEHQKFPEKTMIFGEFR
ncbi:MAG: hypothetical protein M1828_006768 [Chrysothrix sp. TS-e1954]|nr:MAG: hypothetical protein M1828_006768 [Chrysothrix sp. TS-e1954]